MCSFVLIGHWWEEKPNSDAAVKAFLTTRTGDVGLMIGVIVLFFAAGTFNIAVINAKALDGGIGHTLLVVSAACLLIGIIGKSGQFPLHTWLPDAMAGPTPVSALIHAATMVVAGVYLGARLYPVFFRRLLDRRRRRERDGAHRRRHDHHRGGARVRATRHQEGARVLDHQPARLHGDGAGRRGLGGGDLPPVHARVLQVTPLPRGGVGQRVRVASQLRHEGRHGRPAQVHADHVHDVRHRLARAGRHLPARRVLVEGRDPRHRRADRLRRLPVRRPDRSVPDRGLHDPLRVPDVLRRVPRAWRAARVAADAHRSPHRAGRRVRRSPGS